MAKPDYARQRLLRKRLGRYLAANASPRVDRAGRCRSARLASAVAEELGLIERPRRCQSCRDPTARLQRHHWDYARPLDVAFLCPDCHRIADAALKSTGDRRCI